jgi:hypothetical protein
MFFELFDAASEGILMLVARRYVRFAIFALRGVYKKCHPEPPRSLLQGEDRQCFARV